jgi:deferrochelatase/peroxidase EfeB
MDLQISPFLGSHLRRTTGFQDSERATPAAAPTNDDNSVKRVGGRAAVSRRALLLSSLSGAGTLALAGCDSSAQRKLAETGPPNKVPFYGRHQAGVVTSPQRFLQLAAFDFSGERLALLSELLRSWTATGASLAGGRRAISSRGVATDTGEAQELPAARLTVTIGFGPTLFQRDDQDVLGLRRRRPAALTAIPQFSTDALEPRRTGGDLLLQLCADDPQVALYALHTLIRKAHGVATLRWTQRGFLPDTEATPRNTLGFKDGTRNLDVTDRRHTDHHLWVARGDGPAWMQGGTYMVARRVRTLLDVWDETTVEGQEAAVGRVKASGAPLGRRREHDTPNFKAKHNGEPLIPRDAHIRLAAPETNGGVRLLRRSYTYDDGADNTTGQLDVGLAFISFQRDPRTQFIALQRKLAAHDALSRHLLHTGGGVFACPPGCRPGGYIGEGLFA